MKKTMIVALVLASTLLAGNAFAAATALSSGGVSATGGLELVATTPAAATIAKMSTNVVIGATYSASGYALDTYHLSGTKAYGTAYDSTALYFQDLGVGATLTAPSSSLGLEAFASPWVKM